MMSTLIVHREKPQRPQACSPFDIGPSLNMAPTLLSSSGMSTNPLGRVKVKSDAHERVGTVALAHDSR